MLTVRVHLRAKKLEVEVDGDTVRELKKKLLETAPTTTTTIPRPQNEQDGCLLVFHGETELNDKEKLDTQKTYFVFEVFTTVPASLYRTVDVSHAQPAVSSSHKNPFSEVTPLFCAALNSDEAKLPFFYQSGDKTVVRGASLSCKHPQIGKETSFAEICSPENVPLKELEERSFSCELLSSQSPHTSSSPYSQFGVLLSPDLVDKYQNAKKCCNISVDTKKKEERLAALKEKIKNDEEIKNLFEKVDRNEAVYNAAKAKAVEEEEEANSAAKAEAKKEAAEANRIFKESKELAERKQKDKLATQQKLYFCFELCRGENLLDFGAAVVLDNAPEGHFTLIQWKLPPANQKEVSFDKPCAWAQRNGLYQRDDCAFDRGNPEWIMEKYNNTSDLALPFVAQRFQLHCFVIKPSAEPSDHDLASEHQRILLAAARILHRHPNCDFEGLFAIDALRETHFDTTQISHRHLCTLLENFKNILFGSIEEEADDEGDDNDDDRDTLQDGIQTIEDELKLRIPLPMVL
eukprot:m.241868 g.241868  ORF g.241868 m.241868 type:complete len:519 (+) comp27537_c0_seq1:102-1658(+)